MSHTSKPLSDPSLTPQVKNPNATIIQQLGLNGPQGFSRLMMALLAKFDPECKGIELLETDVQHAYKLAVLQGKANISVRGKEDRLILQLRTDDEAAKDIEEDERNTRQSQGPQGTQP